MLHIQRNMRYIRDRARSIKEDLAKLENKSSGTETEEIRKLERSLAELKKDWIHWDRKRQDATKERNRLLGHEE